MGHASLSMEGDIAVITVETLGRLNAFTRAMRHDIGCLLAKVEGDAQSAGAVLTGAGDAFCSGQDLNETTGWDEATPWVEEFEIICSRTPELSQATRCCGQRCRGWRRLSNGAPLR